MYELYFAISNSVIEAYKLVEHIFNNRGLKCSIFESAIVSDKGTDFVINQGFKVVVYETEEAAVRVAVEDLKAALNVEKVYVKKEIIRRQAEG